MKFMFLMCYGISPPPNCPQKVRAIGANSLGPWMPEHSQKFTMKGLGTHKIWCQGHACYMAPMVLGPNWHSWSQQMLPQVSCMHRFRVSLIMGNRMEDSLLKPV